MRTGFVLIFILIITISGTAYAGDVRELSLADAVEIAQKNAQVWTQYDARMESAVAQKKVAQSHWWPVLSLSSTFMLWSDESKIEVVNKEKLRAAMDQSVDNAMDSLGISEEGQKLLHEIVEPLRPTFNSFVQPISDLIPSSITLKDDLTFTFGATLTMPITPLFKVYQAQELAQVGIDNVDAERRGKALAVQFEVTQVYLKLVYAQLMCEVAEEALATIEAHVALAQKYESVGMISHNDVLTAQVEQLKAKQNVVEAKNSTRLAGMKLAQVLSMERGTEVRALNMPRDTFSIQMDSLESYQERAMKQRTELERIELGQEAAERKQKMALLDYVPQIVLIGHYQYGYGLEILKPKNQVFVGLGMTWTLFDGLGHYYESKMAVNSEENGPLYGLMNYTHLIAKKILEDETEINKVGVWLMNELMDKNTFWSLVKPKNIIKSVCLIVVDYSRPWNIINSLTRWCNFAYESFGNLITKLPLDEQTNIRKQSKKIYFNNI